MNLRSQSTGWDADMNEALTQALYVQWLGVDDFFAATGSPAVVALNSPIKSVVWSLAPSALRSIGSSVDRPPSWVRGKCRVIVRYSGSAAHATQTPRLAVRLSFHAPEEDIAAPAATGEVSALVPVHATQNRGRMTYEAPFSFIVHGGHTDGSLLIERQTSGDTYAAGNLYISGVRLEYLPIQEA